MSDLCGRMGGYFDLDRVAFTVLDYPMSWVELAGTLLYVASVVLAATRRLLTWPVGIASAILYIAISWQLRLYADTVEQVAYLAASGYGWFCWRRAAAEGPGGLVVTLSPRRSALTVLAITIALSAGLGALLARVHDWSPEVFPEPASYPFVEAAISVLGFTAILLTALKRIEGWFYLIAVDLAGVGLCLVKGDRFIAGLYALLLELAIFGALRWMRARRSPAGPA